MQRSSLLNFSFSICFLDIADIDFRGLQSEVGTLARQSCSPKLAHNIPSLAGHWALLAAAADTNDHILTALLIFGQPRSHSSSGKGI